MATKLAAMEPTFAAELVVDKSKDSLVLPLVDRQHLGQSKRTALEPRSSMEPGGKKRKRILGVELLEVIQPVRYIRKFQHLKHIEMNT